MPRSCFANRRVDRLSVAGMARLKLERGAERRDVFRQQRTPAFK